MGYFTCVTWEISTQNPARFNQIHSDLLARLTPFALAPLLSSTALVDTDAHSVDDLRHTLDAVCDLYPAEFYYVTSEQGTDADALSGVFPPWANLEAARDITDNDRNPVARNTNRMRILASESLVGIEQPDSRSPRSKKKASKRGKRRSSRRGRSHG